MLSRRRTGLTDINRIVVPVCAGHIGVDLCVDARHVGRLGDCATVRASCRSCQKAYRWVNGRAGGQMRRLRLDWRGLAMWALRFGGWDVLQIAKLDLNPIGWWAVRA